MENLNIKATDQSLQIDFKTDGILTLKGISTPDNVTDFFNPVFNWVKEYSESNPSQLNLDMYIDYLNTSSTRVLVEFLALVRSIKDKGVSTSVIWKYEEDDEDMLELGEEIGVISEIDMNFVAVPETF